MGLKQLNNNEERKRLSEITLLHLIAILMILIAHFLQRTNRFSFLSEVLLSGVPLFLIISGFLCGRSKNLGVKFNASWLIRRIKRILTPYYIVFFTVLLIYVFIDVKSVSLLQVIFPSLAIQGISNYILFGYIPYQALPGLGHLWFVTVILFCYLLTVLISKLMTYSLNKKLEFLIIAIFIFLIQPLLLNIGIQINYIMMFFVGFVLGKYGFAKKISLFAIIAAVCVAVGIIRIISIRYIDGSVFYDRYIVCISTDLISLLIFYSVFLLREQFPRVVDALSEISGLKYCEEISYEVYLIHYIFLAGLFPVDSILKNILLADIAVLLLTFVCSSLLHLICKKISIPILKKN